MKNGKVLRGFQWLGAMLAAGCLLLAGCSSQVAGLDDRDFRDPLIRRANSRERQGDKDGAIACLNKALERKPDLAQAHLQLGLLYDEHKKDYLRAIYHYQCYLEQRPSAQKRGLIEDRIRTAKMSYSASISEQSSEIAKKMLALEEENARLKTNLREVRDNLAKCVSNAGMRAPPAEGREPEVPRPAGGGGPAAPVYCVQPGDTLSLIAGKVYNDPRKWKVILDANSTNLASPGRLRSGQVLNIPR